jgi:drug/metabolite transporter (DMT)-like permease
MIWRILLLILGVYACSTAVIMIKACAIPPVLLSAYRLLGATALLLPLFVRDYRRYHAHLGPRELRRSLLPGLMLAGHFIAWNIGCRLTLAANASLIVNMMPVAMPFLLYVMIRERITRGELVGTALAVAGLVGLALADFHISREHLLGDTLCLVSMVFLTVYLALARWNRDVASIWVYTIPLYFVGGAACLAVGAVAETLPGVTTPRDGLFLAGLILVPTILGHSVLNYSMKHLRGQVVSLTNLAQFIFAGVMAYFWRDEVPGWTFYAASVLIVSGAAVALRSQTQLPVPEAP